MSDKKQLKKIVIGSRESRLAVLQSRLVMHDIAKLNPQMQLELLTMKTTGDMILDRSLDKIGGKGLFVKELDKALIDGRTDLCVHSLKDMPMDLPEDMPIVAYSKREDPRDVFVLPHNSHEWDRSKPVGCSCLRRRIQFQALYPEAQFKQIRGNVISRLEKLDRGEYGALILAAAGLKRLDLSARISRYFEPDEILPSAGQGILAVQGKADHDYSYLEAVHDEESMWSAFAERAFVRYLNGGCSSPVAAFAVIKDQQLRLTGLYFDEQSGRYLTGSLTGAVEQAEEIGIRLAQQLKNKFLKVEKSYDKR